MALTRQITILLWVLYAATAIVSKKYVVPAIAGTNLTVFIYVTISESIVLLLIPLLYRYFLYQYCGCCEKVTVETADAAHSTGNETLAQPLIESSGTEAQNQPTDTPPRRVRYLFLDNAKVFLTAAVIFQHVTCVFTRSCTLISVAHGLKKCEKFFSLFLEINQGYFMPLFFFISAFFVPTSYAKGREKFLRSKWKRILLPALVVSFVIYPIANYLSIGYMTGGKWYYLFFYPGPAWFLFWLLFFNWVYMSIVESTDTSPTSSADDNGIEVEVAQERLEPRMPFPSTWTRLLYSVIFCGIVLQAVKYLLQGGFPQFLLAPIEYGALTANFFMFYAGILARKHGWLEKDLAEQLDIPLYVFFPMVLVECIVYVATILFLNPSPMVGFLQAVTAGAYCVDMSLAVLIIFQRLFNYETKLSKILARSAYCVYLIHEIVILVVTIAYLEFYKSVFGTGEIGKVIGGWLFINVATQVVLWPLSYGLTCLPVLRDII